MRRRQYVNYYERGSAFQVLALVIGTPTSEQAEDTRMTKRLKSTQLLHKKISMLPEGMSMKINDCSTFCKPTLAYGWIDKEPKENMLRKIDGSLWKTIGKTA